MALTNDDKQFIVDTIKSALSVDRKYWKVYMDDLFDTKLEEKLKQYVGNLPTKEEFNSRMDEMMGELRIAREEQAGLSQHDRDQFDVIEALQKIHPHNSHPNFA